MTAVKSRSFDSAAFTRIDAVACLATFTLAALVLLSGWFKSPARANLAGCINNQRQLAQAWRMHAEDNGDVVVGFSDGSISDWRVRPGQGAFLNSPPPGPLPTSARELVVRWDSWGYQLGALYPYAPDARITHCPADNRIDKAVGPAYVSYSGVDGIGIGGANFPAMSRLTRASRIQHPAERYLWVEENDSRLITVTAGLSYLIEENLSTWSMNSPSTPYPAPPNYDQVTQWWDGPAAFHLTGATFPYADGHVAFYRWRDEGTFKFVNNPPAARSGSIPYTSPNDLRFAARGFASVYNP